MYQIIINKLEEATRTKRERCAHRRHGEQKRRRPRVRLVDHLETVTEETEIYRQRVEDLSLDAVIKAVNSL